MQMPIKLIACVCPYGGKLAIGRGNDLLFNLKKDLAHFKAITTARFDGGDTESNIKKNVVVMGRKTWYSLPPGSRPLGDRINIVLSDDAALRQQHPIPKKTLFTKKSPKYDKDIYFMNFDQFVDFYNDTNANVFVIGGGQVYSLFLNHPTLKPTSVHLTEVYGASFTHNNGPDVFMPALDASYVLESISPPLFENGISFRFLDYTTRKSTGNRSCQESKYLELCADVLVNGSKRIDRTSVGTISSFGKQLKMDISGGVPLLTTKRVPWKHCIAELLWFLRGDTDAKVLQRQGVKIWDGNTSREFLDSKNLKHYKEGILGPGYGWNWRFFGANYAQAFADTSDVDTSKIGGVDQIQHVIHELKTNPFSRRILVSAWNPCQLDQVALPPCHFAFQFYVEEDMTGQKHLSCHFMHRSQDLFLGSPFNIFSYTMLTHIIAMKTDMKPKHLVMTVSDAHIYQNHVDQMVEQLSRTPRSLPVVVINPEVKHKDFKNIELSDFSMIGYFPYPAIKAPMAV
jgi:thymidylate synthase